MPDPSIPNVYRVLAIQQGVSGLPRDRFVNSWAFANFGAVVEADFFENVRLALSGFYNGIVLHLANSYRVLGPMEVRMYATVDPVPKQPRAIRTIQVPRNANASTIPNDVAAVMSFRAGANLPRQRGRLYIGPVGINAMSGSTTADSSVSQAFREALVARAVILRDAVNPTWGIISQVDRVFRQVSDIWVDDQPDTQRRRGLRATTRTMSA
jgi:hypothetical protein